MQLRPTRLATNIQKDFILQQTAVSLACSVGLVWDYGLGELVKESQGDLRVVESFTGLYPFIMLASSRHPHASIGTIFQTMLTCPDVIEKL